MSDIDAIISQILDRDMILISIHPNRAKESYIRVFVEDGKIENINFYINNKSEFVDIIKRIEELGFIYLGGALQLRKSMNLRIHGFSTPINTCFNTNYDEKSLLDFAGNCYETLLIKKELMSVKVLEKNLEVILDINIPEKDKKYILNIGNTCKYNEYFLQSCVSPDIKDEILERSEANKDNIYNINNLPSIIIYDGYGTSAKIYGYDSIGHQLNFGNNSPVECCLSMLGDKFFFYRSNSSEVYINPINFIKNFILSPEESTLITQMYKITTIKNVSMKLPKLTIGQYQKLCDKIRNVVSEEDIAAWILLGELLE